MNKIYSVYTRVQALPVYIKVPAALVTVALAWIIARSFCGGSGGREFGQRKVTDQTDRKQPEDEPKSPASEKQEVDLKPLSQDVWDQCNGKITEYVQAANEDANLLKQLVDLTKSAACDRHAAASQAAGHLFKGITAESVKLLIAHPNWWVLLDTQAAEAGKFLTPRAFEQLATGSLEQSHAATLGKVLSEVPRDQKNSMRAADIYRKIHLKSQAGFETQVRSLSRKKPLRDSLRDIVGPDTFDDHAWDSAAAVEGGITKKAREANGDYCLLERMMELHKRRVYNARETRDVDLSMRAASEHFGVIDAGAIEYLRCTEHLWLLLERCPEQAARHLAPEAFAALVSRGSTQRQSKILTEIVTRIPRTKTEAKRAAAIVRVLAPKLTDSYVAALKSLAQSEHVRELAEGISLKRQDYTQTEQQNPKPYDGKRWVFDAAAPPEVEPRAVPEQLQGVEDLRPIEKWHDVLMHGDLVGELLYHLSLKRCIELRNYCGEDMSKWRQLFSAIADKAMRQTEAEREHMGWRMLVILKGLNSARMKFATKEKKFWEALQEYPEIAGDILEPTQLAALYSEARITAEVTKEDMCEALKRLIARLNASSQQELSAKIEAVRKNIGQLSFHQELCLAILDRGRVN